MSRCYVATSSPRGPERSAREASPILDANAEGVAYMVGMLRFFTRAAYPRSVARPASPGHVQPRVLAGSRNARTRARVVGGVTHEVAA